MSKILEDISNNSISVEECLQRLLIIANKTKNLDLAKWCTNEINGYSDLSDLPDYRRFKSCMITYSGINGPFQVKNTPLPPSYLSEKTTKAIEQVSLLEGMYDVEKRKDEKEPRERDLTALASEVYKRTKDKTLDIGVQCTKISQLIPQQFYSEIYTAVKVRIINLLCAFEEAGVGLDSLDIKKSSIDSISKENKLLYQSIVENGVVYTFQKPEKKVLWNVIIPIIVGVVSAVVSGILVYLITNVWMK